MLSFLEVDLVAVRLAKHLQSINLLHTLSKLLRCLWKYGHSSHTKSLQCQKCRVLAVHTGTIHWIDVCLQTLTERRKVPSGGKV